MKSVLQPWSYELLVRSSGDVLYDVLYICMEMSGGRHCRASSPRYDDWSDSNKALKCSCTTDENVIIQRSLCFVVALNINTFLHNLISSYHTTSSSSQTEELQDCHWFHNFNLTALCIASFLQRERCYRYTITTPAPKDVTPSMQPSPECSSSPKCIFFLLWPNDPSAAGRIWSHESTAAWSFIS